VGEKKCRPSKHYNILMRAGCVFPIFPSDGLSGKTSATKTFIVWGEGGPKDHGTCLGKTLLSHAKVYDLRIHMFQTQMLLFKSVVLRHVRNVN
jgi:hypothetical protein